MVTPPGADSIPTAGQSTEAGSQGFRHCNWHFRCLFPPIAQGEMRAHTERNDRLRLDGPNLLQQDARDAKLKQGGSVNVVPTKHGFPADAGRG
jgi:hypothetical protein